MHLTLRKEATRPAGMNGLQQQARFDAFMDEFNNERPHEPLAMKCSAELYTACGFICLHRKKINVSTVLAGQTLGIRKVDDGIWLASFMQYDLGYFDDEACRLEPLQNPFGTKVLPMSPV